METREFGTIKSFDMFKGFGFIQRQKGKDVFFFYNDINHPDKILNPNDKVSFIAKKCSKGNRAFNIQKEAEQLT